MEVNKKALKKFDAKSRKALAKIDKTEQMTIARLQRAAGSSSRPDQLAQVVNLVIEVSSLSRTNLTRLHGFTALLSEHLEGAPYTKTEDAILAEQFGSMSSIADRLSEVSRGAKSVLLELQTRFGSTEGGEPICETSVRASSFAEAEEVVRSYRTESEQLVSELDEARRRLNEYFIARKANATQKKRASS